MPKRVSDLSRITKFFMTCSEAEAVTALDAAQTITGERFGAGPAKTARKSSGRKPKQQPLPADAPQQ